jgi:hypothetical protein
MPNGVLALVLTLTPQGPSPAMPVEPIGAILDALRSHPIVALLNSHGKEQVHSFDLALIRDPRTADIVVESGRTRPSPVRSAMRRSIRSSLMGNR